MSQVERLGRLVSASLCAGCVALTGPARFAVEKIPVPEGSQIYSAEPRPEGVVGGPGAQKVDPAQLRPGTERDA